MMRRNVSEGLQLGKAPLEALTTHRTRSLEKKEIFRP